MSFIRPEVQDGIRRWREVVAGGVALSVGLWLATTGTGAVFLIGCGLVMAGAATALAGIQRGRFRAGSGGPGMVEVDERRITYFGPLTGGGVAIADITDLAVDPSGAWAVRDREGDTLLIPMDAEGAEALFDAFTVLPGLTGSDLVAAARQRPARRTSIWARAHGTVH